MAGYTLNSTSLLFKADSLSQVKRKLRKEAYRSQGQKKREQQEKLKEESRREAEEDIKSDPSPMPALLCCGLVGVTILFSACVLTYMYLLHFAFLAALQLSALIFCYALSEIIVPCILLAAAGLVIATGYLLPVFLFETIISPSVDFFVDYFFNRSIEKYCADIPHINNINIAVDESSNSANDKLAKIIKYCGQGKTDVSFNIEYDRAPDLTKTVSI